jgi:hypothetical protein
MKVSKLVSSLALALMLSQSAFAAEGDTGSEPQGAGADASNAAVGGGLTTAGVVTGVVALAVIVAVASGNGSGTSGTTGTTGTR